MLDLLQGVRIVELSTIVLGPMAGQALADLGAEVVKVEAPGGDIARAAAPHGPSGDGALFVNNNRNKRSVALDLKNEGGRAVLGRLVERADVFLHNMRPEALARLGFDAAACRQANPSLIHCAAVGFGSNGPHGGRPAYDDVIQAASGLAGLPLHLGGEPAYVASIMADKIAALHVVQAVTAALFRRERTGEGCTIEVPMFEAMAAFMLNEHLGAASFEEDGEPGYTRLLTPHRRPFRTADGWIGVLAYDERQWRAVLAEIGRGDIAQEPWFASGRERSRRAGELYAVLGAAMPGRSTDAWLATFERLDVPHARVADLNDLIADPHLEAIGFFRPVPGPHGAVRSLAQPIRFEDCPERPDSPPPALGEHLRPVLAELGYAEAEIEALIAGGVAGAGNGLESVWKFRDVRFCGACCRP